MDRRYDVAVALCVAALGMFLLWAAQGIKPASIADPIGSKGAALLVGIVLAAGGLAVALRRLLRWRREPVLVPSEGVEDDPGVPPGSATRALSIWGAALVYVLALPHLGYLLATPVFLFAVLRLFSIRRPLMLIGVPVGFTVPVFLLFVELLNVRLPTGILDAPLRQLGLV
jgi:putative tricarboxylic transport membrane protein